MNALLRLIGIIPVLAMRLPADFGAGLFPCAKDSSTGGSDLAQPNLTHLHFPRHFTGPSRWWGSQPRGLASAALIPAASLMDHLPQEASLASSAWIDRPGTGIGP